MNIQDRELEQIAKNIASGKNKSNNVDNNKKNITRPIEETGPLRTITTGAGTYSMDPRDLGNINEKNIDGIKGERIKQKELDYIKEQTKTDIYDTFLDDGYKNIPISLLPSNGIFYPSDWYITIRSATVGEIRHFSTVDEFDAIDVIDKYDFILERCLRVKSPKGIISYKHMLEIDRFYLIFAIREYTFINGENQLTVSTNCPSCKQKNDIIISRNVLDMFLMNDKLKRLVDVENLCFNIETKDGDKFEIFMPTIGTQKFISSYIKNALINGTLDSNMQSFIKFAPYLFSDFRELNNNTLQAKMRESQNWSVLKLSILNTITNIIEESSRGRVKKLCSSCGSSEVTAPLRFHGGVKSIFLFSDIFAELI
jgi:hypothetical protein